MLHALPPLKKLKSNCLIMYMIIKREQFHKNVYPIVFRDFS